MHTEEGGKHARRRSGASCRRATPGVSHGTGVASSTRHVVVVVSIAADAVSISRVVGATSTVEDLLGGGDGGAGRSIW